MFDLMRPYIIITNLMTLIWFIALQYYRFKDTGRACSGDLLKKMPGNFGQVYMPEQGQWFRYFVICQYGLYIIQKLLSIIITNKLEAQFDQRR